jgi:hypothetical protein
MHEDPPSTSPYPNMYAWSSWEQSHATSGEYRQDDNLGFPVAEQLNKT